MTHQPRLWQTNKLYSWFWAKKTVRSSLGSFFLGEKLFIFLCYQPKPTKKNNYQLPMEKKTTGNMTPCLFTTFLLPITHRNQPKRERSFPPTDLRYAAKNLLEQTDQNLLELGCLEPTGVGENGCMSNWKFGNIEILHDFYGPYTVYLRKTIDGSKAFVFFKACCYRSYFKYRGEGSQIVWICFAGQLASSM